MAHLTQKDGIYLVRFKHGGKHYKRSLKTRDRGEAKYALHRIEVAIHQLLTGQTEIPPGVDPGDFLVSGGTIKAPQRPPTIPPTVDELIEEFLASQFALAESSLATAKIHLKHLQKHLGGKAGKHAPRSRDVTWKVTYKPG